MIKKQLKELVMASYKKSKLDAKTVDKIAKILSRKDLKAYVRALKLEQNRHQVTVALPSARLYNTSNNILGDIFPQKEILVVEDEDLLLGVRITDTDNVYDMTLKEEFDKIKDEVNTYYGS